MAYDTLKAEIRQYIKTNGANEITGQILQNVLLDMVNAYSSLDGYATQQWVQNQGYLTSEELGSYATQSWVNTQLGGYLPLTGGTLTGDLNIAYSSKLNFGTSYIYQSTISGPHGTNMGHILNFYGVDGYGYYDFDNSVHATSFVKSGGTSSQFLKADGSVDENTYITASELTDYATQSWVNTQLGGYLPLTGGTLTGDLNIAYSSKLNFGTSYIYQSTISGPHGTNMGHILNFYGVDGNGYYDFDNSVHATSFVKSGGTSSQFLKADGSVDSNTYLTSSAISDMATQMWVGNNYLPLTGGTITSNLTVNGELDSFSRMQVNGTSADKPFFRFHIPNVNWARLQMDTDGVIHVLDGSHGTSYNGFACGNLDVNGTLAIAPNKSLSFGTTLEIFKVSTTGMLVMKNDEHDIVLGSIGNNFYVSFIEDIQGGTANSDYSMNTVNWGITTAGAATFVSVTQTSDIRRKNIISDIGMAIDDIAKAPMFRFTMKDDDEATVRVGTSAQYWQTVIPEVVSEDKRGVLGLQYDVAALAGVITVAKRVVDHEARIAELEKENALLKVRLNIN